MAKRVAWDTKCRLANEQNKTETEFIGQLTEVQHESVFQGIHELGAGSWELGAGSLELEGMNRRTPTAADNLTIGHYGRRIFS